MKSPCWVCAKRTRHVFRVEGGKEVPPFDVAMCSRRCLSFLQKALTKIGGLIDARERLRLVRPTATGRIGW